MDDDRRKKRKQRTDITNEIGDLIEMNCDPCTLKKAGEPIHVCLTCPVFVQLGELGEQLMTISKQTKRERFLEYLIDRPPVEMKPVEDPKPPEKPKADSTLRKWPKKKIKKQNIIKPYLSRGKSGKKVDQT